jgi:hypothetical protein
MAQPSSVPPVSPALGPVPEANQPGHHPPVEQDKPRRRPPRPKGSIPRTTRWDLRFALPVSAISALAGAVPRTTEVEVGETHLSIRYGPWSLRTELANVAEVSLTGPFSSLKVGGPPRLSLADRGITFATATTGGVCIRFDRPVRAADPLGLIRHPGCTITVEDPEGFKAELEAAVRRAT